MTSRKNIVMRLLLFQLRILEQSQLNQITPFDRLSKNALSRWIKSMEQKGFLHTTRTVSVVPQVDLPLVDWSVENQFPPMDLVRNQLRHRWRGWIPKRCTVIWATSYSVRLFGGVAGGRRQPLQLAHDLGTSAVYVRSIMQNRGIEKQWYGEDYLRQIPVPFSLMPDAALFNPSNKTLKLIEFGGQYSLEKLNRWHQACKSAQLPYELW